MALPRFAPSTNASAASGETNCENANDMISNTVATLECAAHVSAAPISTQSTGSPVISLRSARTLGAFSAGAQIEKDVQCKQHQT